MEKYHLPADLILYAIEVKTFPNHVKDTFDMLYSALGEERPYYGVSWFDDKATIKYFAAVAELTPDEQKQFDYETITIQKGEYVSVTVMDWMSKTDSIKDVFHNLIRGRTPDKHSPCIEWYKSDDEMICMVRS